MVNSNSTRLAIRAGLISLLVILIAGCQQEPTPAPPTATPTPAPASITAPAAATARPTLASPTTPATSTTVITATATICAPPIEWPAYTVAQDDTLSSLAVTAGSSVEAIMLANCLTSDLIVVGQQLRLPALPLPTATPTPVPTRCGQPVGWSVYVVKAGDTLSGLAARFGVSVAALRQANCLEDDTIYADRGLFAPPGAAAQTAPPAVGAGGSAPMVDTPTPPTHTQPPTEEVDQCTTPFSCSTKVEKLGAAIALPNNGVLCPATVTDILIDIARAGARLSPTAESVAAGATVRFGACNFADPATTRATLIRIDAATPMPLPMFLNGQGARSFGVATWPATCVDSMLGDYRVEIVDAQETPIARTFTLRRLDPGGTSLMAVPDAGGSGSFDLYLCGQVPVSPDTVSLVLESGVIDAATNRCVRRWERIDDIPPVESGNGFVHMVLTLPLPSDEAEINCYQVTHRDTFAGAVIQIAR